MHEFRWFRVTSCNCFTDCLFVETLKWWITQHHYNRQFSGHSKEV